MTRLAFLLLLLLGACARSEDAAFVPPDNEAARTVETVKSSDEGAEDELAIGDWRDSVQDEQAAVEFGPLGAPALFSLRCNARHDLLLQRHGAAPGGDLPVMLVTIGSETRRLAISSTAGPLPMLRATLAPSDPFLAVLSGATAPIIVRIGDSPPLVMPPSPAIGAYIASCANGTPGGRSLEPEAESNGITEVNSVAQAPPPPARAPAPAHR
jgi:hypothetical protein